MKMTPEQHHALMRGYYGVPARQEETVEPRHNEQTEVILDQIDTLLAGVSEETAGAVMQLVYQLAEAK